MRSGNNNVIKTEQKISPLFTKVNNTEIKQPTDREDRTDRKDRKDLQTETIEDLKNYGQQITDKNDIDCQSAKTQIMKNITFKINKEQESGLQQITPNDQKTSIGTAPVNDQVPLAPELENFEDYAPVDTPVGVKSPTDRGYIKVKPDHSKPVAANELGTVHQNKFTSEYRVPWSGKKGKDDLSYFFDTHHFDTKFDQAQRRPVACPNDWDTKHPY